MKIKRFLLALTLTACSIPAAAQQVAVGDGDWSDLPLMIVHDEKTIPVKTVEKIRNLVVSGECQIPGVSKRKVDMTVPFIVRFNAKGGVENLVVKKVGCAKAESILASLALGLVWSGNFKPTGENRTGWYRSELSFMSL